MSVDRTFSFDFYDGNEIKPIVWASMSGPLTDFQRTVQRQPAELFLISQSFSQGDILH